MNDALVIGIDASTTACKAVVWDLAGRSIAEGRAALPLESPQPAWREQPAEAWWQALVTALRQALAQVDAARLHSLCITHQRETFVPVDAEGRPLRPAMVWMDERARSLLPALRQQMGEQAFHQITGKPLTANLTVAKIAWLRQHEPQVFERTWKYLDVQAYLVGCLTGETRTGWGSADPTGLFDMRQNGYAGEVLAALGLRREQLPEAFPPGAALGRVTPEAARQSSLPQGLPVCAGLGDGQSAGLGANLARPGEVYLSLGTSVISGMPSRRYLTDLAFRTHYSGLPGQYFLETVLLGGAYTLDWLLSAFLGSQPQDLPALHARLSAAAAALEAGAAGLLLVPYWNSVMNPYWEASASGIVVGWRGEHTPAHLYRAILEGIAFEQRLYTEGVAAALGEPVEVYIAAGGGARSDLWSQIIADVTGRPVQRDQTLETAALGAGILAAAGANLFPNVASAAQAMGGQRAEVFQPDPQRQAVYDQFYEVYRGLYPALRESLTRLADLAERE